MHPDSAHPLHEMLICHVRGGYVQPHGHSGRSVSFSFIEGRALVVLFEEDGRPKRFIPIGPPGSSRVSFLRLPANTIYTFLLEDDCILILETILGPFDPRQNMWAEWAPPSDAAVAGERYLAELRRASVAALGG
jgi:cupin fold WbuC family metalloprotein